MSNDLALTQSFQEKVFERIRDSIGDLMSEADLKALVDSALQKAFFERRKSIDSYGREKTNDMPWIVQQVGDLLNMRVQEAVKAWVDAHPEEITKIINDLVGQGLSRIVLQQLDQKMQSALYNFGNQLQSALGR